MTGCQTLQPQEDLSGGVIDVLKLLDKYKGMASVLVSNGKTCLF